MTNGDFSQNASSYVVAPGYNQDGAPGDNPSTPTGWINISGGTGLNGADTNYAGPTPTWSPFGPANDQNGSLTLSSNGDTIRDFGFIQGVGAYGQTFATAPGNVYGVTLDAANRAGDPTGTAVITVGDGNIATGLGSSGTITNLSQNNFQNYGFGFQAAASGTSTLNISGLSGQTAYTNVAVRDISAVWSGTTSGNLGGPDQNFGLGNFNAATASAKSGGTLYFNDTNGAGTAITNTNLITQPGAITSGTLQFNNSAVNYTLNSADANGVSGSAGISKSGSGTLSLVGPNTYSGPTVVSGGTLAAGVGNVISNGNFANPSIGANSYIYYPNLSPAQQTALVWAGNGSAVLINNSGAWGYSTPYPASQQAISLQNQASLSETVALTAGTYQLNFSMETRPGNSGNPVEILVNGNLVGTVSPTSSSTWTTYSESAAVPTAGNYTIEFLGTVPGSVSDQSTGLSAVSLYQIPPQNNTLSPNSAVSLANAGALLDIAGTQQTIGSLAGVAGSNVALGGGTLTIGNDNTSTNFAGSINDTGGVIVGTGGSLVKVGSGALTLSGVNSYSGSTTVSAGTLVVGNASALGANTSTLVVTGGALDLSGNSPTVGAFNGSGGSVVNNGGGLASLIVGNGNANGSYAGTIADGLSQTGLTKVGSGTESLVGTNTYSGPTVISAGTLLAGFGNAINDGTFATPNLGLGNFGYLNSGNLGTAPAGLGWSTNTALGTDNSAGGPGPALFSNGSAWGYSNVPAGTQGISLQRDSNLSETLTLAPGTYTLNFALENRPSDGGSTNPVNVSLDGNQLGATITPSAAAGWTDYSETFTVAGGTHTITFAGTVTGPDVSTGLSDVTLGSTPQNNTLSPNSAVSLTNAGALLDIAGTQQTIGSLAGVAGSNVALGDGTLTIGNDNTSTNFAGSINDTGGVIVGTGGSLVKVGSGALTLSGVNSYSGSTTVSAGTLVVGNASALGANTSTLVVTGGALDLSGNSPTVGAFNGSGGSVVNNGGGLASLIVGNGNANGSYAGTIADGLSQTGLTKVGSGTESLVGTNTYSGPTVISAGTLLAGFGNAINDGTFATPNLGLGNFGYLNSGNLGTAPAGLGWSTNTALGTDNSAGGPGPALFSNGSAWGYSNVPAGTQGISLQRDSNLSETLTLAPGTYTLNFALENRPSDGGSTNPVNVSLDGNQLGATITPSAAAGWTDYSETFTVAGGTHTITFAGTVTGPDVSTGLSDVTLGSTPQNNTLSPNSAVSLANAGALLDIAGTQQTIGSLAGVAGSNVALGDGTLTIGNDNTSTNFAGSINDTGGAIANTGGGIAKIGSGTLTLSGANGYSGGTSVQGGTLAIAGSGTLGAGNTSLTITGGATLDLGGTSQTVGQVGNNGAGNGIVGNIVDGTLNIQGNNLFFQKGALTADLTSTPGSAGRLWIGGDPNATVVLGGNNNVQYGDTHSTIIGYPGTTGAAGTVELVSNTALGPNSQQAQLFTGTVDLNGQSAVTVGSLALESGGASVLTNSSSTGAVFNNQLLLSQADSQVGGNAGSITLGGVVADNGTPGGLNKVGSDTVNLNSGTYSGNTTVSGGLLNITGSIVNNGSANVFVQSGGSVFGGAGSASGGEIDRSVAASAPYTGYGSQDVGAGTNHTTADINAGAANIAAGAVDMSWRNIAGNEAFGSAASPPFSLVNGQAGLVSDVLNLNGMATADGPGTATDPFAMTISYNPSLLMAGHGSEAQQIANGDIRLDWLNPGTGTWQTAATGDNATGPLATTAFQGTFGAFALAEDGLLGANYVESHLSQFLGSWGADPTTHTAWAIVDHNSAFAVAVPEPSSWVLACAGVSALLGVYFKRRRSDRQRQGWQASEPLGLPDGFAQI